MAKAQPSPVTIMSTTDSKEAVDSALGKKPVEQKEEPQRKLSFKNDLNTKPAAKEKPDTGKPEAKTVSESEPEETEELESKADHEGDGEDHEDSEERPKKKGGFQKRIDKLSKARSEAERERDYWREQALKGAQPANKVEEPKKADQAKPDQGKPNKDDFESHEAYIEALADWKAEQKIDKKLADRDQKQKEETLKTQQEKIRQDHLKRVAEFKKDHADFDEVLNELADQKISYALTNAIVESENGPELMYELAKDPEEFERINSLPPDKAARAIGRFEAKLEKGSSEEVEPKKKQTKAPTPIKPIGSKAGTKATSADDLPFDEWRKVRDAEIKSRGGSTLR